MKYKINIIVFLLFVFSVFTSIVYAEPIVTNYHTDANGNLVLDVSTYYEVCDASGEDCERRHSLGIDEYCVVKIPSGSNLASQQALVDSCRYTDFSSQSNCNAATDTNSNCCDSDGYCHLNVGNSMSDTGNYIVLIKDTDDHQYNTLNTGFIKCKNGSYVPDGYDNLCSAAANYDDVPAGIPTIMSIYYGKLVTSGSTTMLRYEKQNIASGEWHTPGSDVRTIKFNIGGVVFNNPNYGLEYFYGIDDNKTPYLLNGYGINNIYSKLVFYRYKKNSDYIPLMETNGTNIYLRACNDLARLGSGTNNCSGSSSAQNCNYSEAAKPSLKNYSSCTNYSTYVLRIDSIAPVVKNTDSNNPVTIEVTETGSGVKEYCMVKSGSSPTSSCWKTANVTNNKFTTTSYAKGSYDLYLRDVAGNESEAYSINITKEASTPVNPDPTPTTKPKLTASDNKDNKISVVVSDVGSGIKDYCVNTKATDTSGCTWNTISKSSFTTIEVTKSGTYYVHVRDTEGNIGHSSAVKVTYNSGSSDNHTDEKGEQKNTGYFVTVLPIIVIATGFGIYRLTKKKSLYKI